MPRIPIIQAESPAAVQRLPQRLPYADYSGLGQAGQAFEQFGQQLSGIGAKLQEQQNELDTAKLVGEFSGKVKEIETNLRYVEKDPLKWSKVFTEKTTELQNKMVSTASNKMVAKAFTQHVGRHLPIRAAEVHANALEWMGQQQTADLRDVGDLYAQQKAEAPSFAEAQAWDAGYRDLLRKNPHFKPEEMQKEEERWKTKSNRAYMEHLARTDPQRLFEEDKKGYFDDFPDTHAKDLILARAERQRNSEVLRAETVLKNTMKQYGESVERFVEGHKAAGTLTKDIVETWGPVVSSEKKTLWDTWLHDQLSGVRQGDPVLEANFVTSIHGSSPRAALAELNSGYMSTPKRYGREFYDKYAPYLENKVQRLEDKGEARQEKGETQVRQRQESRGRYVLDNSDEQFKVTGAFSLKDFDFTVSEAKIGYRQDFMANVDYLNGGRGMDAAEVERRFLPKWLSHVSQRIGPKIEALRKALGQYQSKPILQAAQGKIPQGEWNRYSDLLEGLHTLLREQQAYEIRLKALGGARGTVTKPEGRTE